MYADDLILLSEPEKGLQNQIMKLNLFCKNWNLSINTKKTKIMTFNRGNRIIKTNIMSNKTPLDDVKSMKYLGFAIPANQCSFAPTLVDLSIKANRAIFCIKQHYQVIYTSYKISIEIILLSNLSNIIVWLGSSGSLR